MDFLLLYWVLYVFIAILFRNSICCALALVNTQNIDANIPKRQLRGNKSERGECWPFGTKL